ncbi:hypothetical protein BDY19DRAFT_870040, partial [Irpex rosettiformis]
MFDAVKSIFTRQAELSDSLEIDQAKNTRLVITKIVNALTAQSEIGAPMAAMYLLNHPDHYTDHKFERFYWKRYINEVRDVCLSPVHDYMYRPEKYKDVCLYDWIRLARKSKQLKRQKKKDSESEDELNTENTVVYNENDEMSDSDIDIDSELEIFSEEADIEILDKKNDGKEKNTEYHTFGFFLDDHPQCETHRVRVVEEKDAKIPDFIGGVLPRKDKGNREEYCLTMLSLFKPWRSGLDLKDIADSWSKTFDSYDFSHRQKEIMSNFNLRYECRDARDDFAAQRKAKGRGITDWPVDLTDDVLDEMNNNSSQVMDIDTAEYGEEDQWEDHASNDKSSTRQINRMIEAENMLEFNGLL